MNTTWPSKEDACWTAVVLGRDRGQWDGLRASGPSLQAIVESQATFEHPYQVLRLGDVVAVVSPENVTAQAVAQTLQLHWDRAPSIVRAPTPEKAGPARVEARYTWRTHAPLVLSHKRAWACWHETGVTVHVSGVDAGRLRRELASLLDLDVAAVDVVTDPSALDIRAHDAGVDAAVIARAIGHPVSIDVAGVSQAGSELFVGHMSANCSPSGSVQAWSLIPSTPLTRAASAMSLASLASQPQAFEPPIHHSSRPVHLRMSDDIYTSALKVEPAIQAVSLGQPGHTLADALAMTFCRESFVDEIAAVSTSDPVKWRVERLIDPRARALMEKVAASAQWQTPVRVRNRLSGKGRGVAFASVPVDVDSAPRQACAAWIVDVSVDADTGAIAVDRITVGHCIDEMHVADASDGLWQQQIDQATQRLLGSAATFDRWTSAESESVAGRDVAALDQPTGSGPLRVAARDVGKPQPFGDVPAINTSAALTLPAAAALANAIFDATGVRLRDAPFNTAVARRQLMLAGRRPVRRLAAWAGGIAAAAAGLALMASPWRAAIAPVTPDLSVYSTEAIERGRLIAAASDCVVCHTAEGGQPNAGGLALDTPFGQIYTTNITPDPDTGIGRWSFSAFDRAMRQGIGQDGRHLYPAFPYTAFAKFSDADMQALYAYLMTQTPVVSTPSRTELKFPFNQRPLLAAWNLLYHDAQPFTPDESQSLLWNRGAYLVQGAGHCSACHTPRNSLGAEKSGVRHFLSGGVAEGWDAPALNASSTSPLAWTEDDMFSYLRTGFSERHGVAAGPMAPVIEGLRALPDQDIRAMATYLTNLEGEPREPASAAGLPAAATAVSPVAPATPLPTTSASPVAPATPQPTTSASPVVPATPLATTSASPEADGARVLSLAGQNVFNGSCAACHDSQRGTPLFGVRPNLAYNTSLTNARPDNLLRVILEGITNPADPGLGYMPAFADSLNDDQIVELASYLRETQAGAHPPWTNLKETVRALRQDIEQHAQGAR